MYKIYKNKVFKTKIGELIKFIDKDSKILKKFGEIYFNNIKNSKKKNDWISHKKYQCIILVITGRVNFEIKNKKQIRILKLDNNVILKINPRTWFRFSSITKNALFVNLIDGLHNPNETIRKKID